MACCSFAKGRAEEHAGTRADEAEDEEQEERRERVAPVDPEQEQRSDHDEDPLHEGDAEP